MCGGDGEANGTGALSCGLSGHGQQLALIGRAQGWTTTSAQRGPGQPFRRPRLRGVIETIVFDVGETITRDDRYWESWADWLDVPRHTLSALVGAVVARGQDNAEALRLVRPGIDVAAEYHARETAGRGEYLDESDLYDDVRPALSALRELGVRVVVAGNQTSRAGGLLRALDLPVDLTVTSGD